MPCFLFIRVYDWIYYYRRIWISLPNSSALVSIFMDALRSRCGHYIFVLWFLSSFFFLRPPYGIGQAIIFFFALWFLSSSSVFFFFLFYYSPKQRAPAIYLSWRPSRWALAHILVEDKIDCLRTTQVNLAL